MLDLTKLIITVLTSSVVGAVVSNLFSEWQKRNEYKRDYYKKIIDRRMKAYEVVETFASCFDVRARDESTDTKFLLCCSTVENAKNTFEYLKTVEKYILWIDKDCKKCVEEINQLLLPLLAFDETQAINQGNERIKKSIEICEELEYKRDKLRDIIKKNIIKLHDVDSFFKN